ncbi:hypothetical protein ACFTWF_34970 [Rhodococcus sp. NPDC056960]|uniref:hypothetical protein n=1 Tax=Rhodococcus sp. NPDC056960 TaxID=3345982 RepID=UPI0036314E2C
MMESATVGFLVVSVIAWVIVAVIFGLCASTIAERKYLNGGNYLLLAFLLGPLAIVVAGFMPARPRPAPTGMVSLECSVCNARQNVAKEKHWFSCWQCKQRTDVVAASR